MANSVKKTRSGFTLLEMIVVVAIIGILTGIFVPSMLSYVRRSRLNAANAEAKVIFNSMQTICQELEFKERPVTVQSTEFYGQDTSGATTKAVKTGSMILVYQQDKDGKLEFAGASGGRGSDNTYPDATLKGILEGDPGVSEEAKKTPNPDEPASSFMTRLMNVSSDLQDYCFCAYVKDYQVKAVICATSPTAAYLGGYPNKAVDKGGFSPAGSSVSAEQLQAKDFSTLATTPYDILKAYVADSNGGNPADY